MNLKTSIASSFGTAYGVRGGLRSLPADKAVCIVIQFFIYNILATRPAEKISKPTAIAAPPAPISVGFSVAPPEVIKPMPDSVIVVPIIKSLFANFSLLFIIVYSVLSCFILYINYCQVRLDYFSNSKSEFDS